MLRNSSDNRRPVVSVFLLNEVLSLNAQESRRTIRRPCWPTFLNEVLSLNAQESGVMIALMVVQPGILNEVLSLNAQEWCRFGWYDKFNRSSMKS